MSAIEQRAAITFFLLLKKSFSETFELIKNTYENDAYGRTQVYE